jgi:hypothetical protein
MALLGLLGLRPALAPRQATRFLHPKDHPMTAIDTAEKMLAELSDVVSHIHAPQTAGVHSVLGAMTLSDNHINSARMSGHDAAQTVAALQRRVGDAIESLKQFRATMPADDPNIASINDLITRLA